MAVEKSAVREGTRWWFDGEEVLVQEVTSKSVVFLGDCGLGLIAIADFLVRAEDPAISRHERMVKRFSRLVGRDPSDEIGGAILYLLERIGAPLPGPVTAWAEPTSHSPVVDLLPADAVAALSEAYAVPGEICVVAAPEPLEDCVVAAPTCEPAIKDRTIEEYDRVRRDFVASDGKSRNLKRKGSW